MFECLASYYSERHGIYFSAISNGVATLLCYFQDNGEVNYFLHIASEV